MVCWFWFFYWLDVLGLVLVVELGCWIDGDLFVVDDDVVVLGV